MFITLFNLLKRDIHFFKDGMSVSLSQNCLNFTMEPQLGSEFRSCKYEKLPDIIMYAC